MMQKALLNRNSTKPLTVKETDVKHRALKDQQRANPAPLAVLSGQYCHAQILAISLASVIPWGVSLLTQLQKPNKSLQYYTCLGAEIKLELITNILKSSITLILILVYLISFILMQNTLSNRRGEEHRDPVVTKQHTA